MVRLLTPLLLLALLYLGWRAFARLPRGRRKQVGRWLLWALTAALVVLAASGRIHWLLATLPPLAVLGRWLGRLLSAWPLVMRLLAALGMGRGAAPGAGTDANAGADSRGGAAPPPDRGTKMSRARALAVLGLREGASREEILAAYRRLMQKMHPDTGGSDYLAAEINQARDVLLDRR